MTDIQVDAIRSRAIDTAKTEYDIGYWKGRKDGIHYVMGYPQHLEMALQEAESPVEEE